MNNEEKAIVMEALSSLTRLANAQERLVVAVGRLADELESARLESENEIVIPDEG